MRILCAPTAFKETLSAVEAARLFAEVSGGRPFPVADGGDGTLEAVQFALGGSRRRVTAPGPLGDPVEAEVLLLSPRIAVAESASACGLRLVPRGLRDPLRARTWGVAALLRAAGPREIWLGVGGTATMDGGLGALAELGPEAPSILRRTTILADVRTRFLDAPRVFGPQKGASPADVRLLERWFREWAARLPCDVRRLEGSGSAGALAGGLAAFGARIVPGAPFLLKRTGFDRALRSADLVLTGEGRFDATSLQGKAAGAVIAAARRRGVPVAVVCGSFDLRRPPPGVVAVAEAGSPSGVRRAVMRAIQAARRRGR